jgi:phospholipase C
MENKDAGDVLGRAPYVTALGRRYAVLTRYRGVAHPSLPNYLALTAGTTAGITSDCEDCPVDARNLADSLEARGRTWKEYAEDLHGAGYSKKHSPFEYYVDVVSNPARRARVVPLTAFARDLARGTLPSYSLVVPNLCHDMHDCSVATGDAWLHSFLPALLASPQLRRGAVFVVWDEDEGGGDAPIPALALGPLVRRGARSPQPLTHYSLLRTIEDALGLERLGRSARAAPIEGIWR